MGAHQPSTKSIIERLKDNPAVVIITASCTIIPVLISLGTIGVAFNDRVYASKQDVADLNVKVEKRTAILSTKLDLLLSKNGIATPHYIDDSIMSLTTARTPQAQRGRHR